MDQQEPQYSEVVEQIKQIHVTIRHAKALIVATEVRIAEVREGLVKLEQSKATYHALRAGRMSVSSDGSRPS